MVGLVVRESGIYDTSAINLPDIHGLALNFSFRYISEDKVQQISKRLNQIEKVTDTEVIEALSLSGNVSPEVVKVQKVLANKGIYAGLMTPEEAKKVAAFAYNASDSIKEQKAERIRDIVYSTLNGKELRRDYSFNQEKHARLEKIVNKYTQFERGEIDTSRCFDITGYINTENISGEDDCDFADIQDFANREYGLYIARDTYESYTELRGSGDNNLAHYIEVLDDDDLIEGGYIDEGDIFQYAPYTYKDLEDLELFSWSTWTEATNYRHKSRLGGLLEEYIPGRGNTVEDDLIRDFIAREILINRRLNVRDLITLVSSFALQSLEKIDKIDKTVLSGIKSTINDFKRSLGYCSYYAGMICGLQKQELRVKYKSVRPLAKEFFTELLSRVDNWTDLQANSLDFDFTAFLIVLDDHLFNAEALFIEIIQAVEGVERETVTLT